MKRYIVILTVMLTVVCSVFTTKAASLVVREVGFDGREMTIAQALGYIERQTGYIFAVNNSSLDTSRKVVVPEGNMDMEELLNLVLSGTGHTYTLVRKHIIISPETKPVVVVQEKPAPPKQPENRMQYDVVKKTVKNEPVKAPVKVVVEQPLPATVVEPVVQPVTAAKYTYKAGDLEWQVPGRLNGNSDIPERFGSPISGSRPRWALKTNALYWATLTPNLALEVGLGKKTSVSIWGSYNPWNLEGTADNNDKIVHWVVQPEFRYWLCERYNGHHFGANLIYIDYNVGGKNFPGIFEKDYRYQGIAYGGGLSYGYHLMLGTRWGIEFTVGVGFLAMTYDQYDCDKCGDLVDTVKKTYFGPTKIGVSAVFLIK